MATPTVRVPNGAAVVETTSGSDIPPLTQLTVDPTETEVLAELTITDKAGVSVNT